MLVTETTPAEDLAQMNRRIPVENKQGHKFWHYPVYLANEKYGMRGVNYRGNITLIIAARFGDRRERLQGLYRVGRQGDLCHRIQDTSKSDIDGAELAARKGKIMCAKAEMLRLKQQEQPSFPGPNFELDVANKKKDLHDYSLAD